MSDQELIVQPDQELSFDMFNPDDFRPDVKSTEKPRLPRISIVQSTSTDYIQAGARPGQFVLDWKDPTKPAQFVNSLRVFLIDRIMGRVMFPYQDDGKPDRRTKDPWCASSDGLSPRSGDQFGYIGKTYTDWRNKKQVTITETCDGCPLARFRTYKDADGKSINQAPPCQEAPQFVLWLVDQAHPAIFQSSAPTVRVRLEGQPKKGHPGLNKFFQVNGVDPQTGASTYPFRQDGKWFPVKISAKMETHKSGNTTYVPVVELDTTPMVVEQVKAIFDIKQMYAEADENGMTERDRLSGQAYLGDSYDYDEDDTVAEAAEKERLTPPGAAKAAKALGSNGGGKKRITDKHEAKGDDDDEPTEGDDAF